MRSPVELGMNQTMDLIEKLSSELRSGVRPLFENIVGFFHAIDWTERWLKGLVGFHVVLLVVTIFSRKNTNFQICLFFMALAGVFFAEQLNTFLGNNWRSFARQNYFDPHGVFLSTLWSCPLLCIAIIILINTLLSLCFLMVRWKKAELRHRARGASRDKQD